MANNKIYINKKHSVPFKNHDEYFGIISNVSFSNRRGNHKAYCKKSNINAYFGIRSYLN